MHIVITTEAAIKLARKDVLLGSLVEMAANRVERGDVSLDKVEKEASVVERRDVVEKEVIVANNNKRVTSISFQ